jgi:hypothetical protein
MAIVKFSKSADEATTWSPPVSVSNPSHNAFFPAIGVTYTGGTIVLEYLTEFVFSNTPGPHAAYVQTLYGLSHDGGGTWMRYPLTQWAHDVDGSTGFSLTNEKLGDYTSIVVSTYSGATTAFPVWTDTRNAVPCPLIDSYRTAVAAGQHPPKPDPDVNSQCPLGFGNTDIYSAAIQL